MKAQKVDNVSFAIEQEDPDVRLNLVNKEGALYLSLSDLFLREDGNWYEIPIEKLEDIEVQSKDPLELKFSIPSLNIKVRGEYAEKLLALRHLLLPYIQEKIVEEDPFLSTLKIWGMGIHKKEAIGDLLSMDPETVNDHINKAKEEGYIEGGKLTERAVKLLNTKNGHDLEKLEE